MQKLNIGDLVCYGNPRNFGLHRVSDWQGDVGIVIELSPYDTDGMVRVFWSKEKVVWSVPTKDMVILSAAKK